MRSLLLLDHPIDHVGTAKEPQPVQLLQRLEQYGYQVLYSDSMKDIYEIIDKVDAIIFHLPLECVKAWLEKLSQRKTLPTFWWCSERMSTLSLAYCEDCIPVDGLLTPSMTEHEMHWALFLGNKQSLARLQWIDERKQLEARLEERKWLDKAKGILCKIKNISEAEAYEILRKQAMNERKRLVDVAISIVKVYNILEE